MRTDQEIFDQTLELARRFYAIRGYLVKEGHRFDESTHPHEVEVWEQACEAQEMLTHTDMINVVSNLEE